MNVFTSTCGEIPLITGGPPVYSRPVMHLHTALLHKCAAAARLCACGD